METVLSVRKLTKTFRVAEKAHGFLPTLGSLFSPSYRTVTAVNDISFSVERGEILAFIGPNGAGKSTTIKLITGILFPTTGEIEVLGLNPHKKRKALAYRIGTVFGQKSQLWFHLPPLDSFRLLADIYDLDRATAGKRIAELTELFEIGDYLRTPVRKLSLGERIRCEIAASLIHKPEILFLDEPTIGLDVIVKQIIRDLIRRVNDEEHMTVFLTSHDTGDIEKICRRAIVINHGRIAWDDSIKTMKYSLLRRKVIDLKLESPLVLDAEGVEVVKAKGYAAKIEADLTRIQLDDLVARIMRDNRVADITISNPPMEEIISMIYKAGAPGGDGVP